MMEIPDLNKSLCEELFGGEMDVTEMAPDFLQYDKITSVNITSNILW